LNDLLLRACRLERTERTPIWLMRQAGRYLPSFRELRKRHGLLELCRNPELAARATALPVEELGVDAAIIFHDITLLLEAMGAQLEEESGEGPRIRNRLRSPEQLEEFAVPSIEKEMGYLLEAIRKARRLLGDRVPLIGFSGAPFTLACYLIEGGPSRDFISARAFLYRNRRTWHLLMAKLQQACASVLRAQAEAGAHVLQLFDSWAGWLGLEVYEELVLPYTLGVLKELRDLGVPCIYFSTGSPHLLPLLGRLGADVIGVDWRLPLDEAWARLGEEVGIQGNLDPAALLGSSEELLRRALEVLKRAGGRPGHIFNLGHGVPPQAPLDNVRLLVDFVKKRGLANAGSAALF
jgi:uroporphyrinogen decarboxylase